MIKFFLLLFLTTSGLFLNLLRPPLASLGLVNARFFFPGRESFFLSTPSYSDLGLTPFYLTIFFF